MDDTLSRECPLNVFPRTSTGNFGQDRSNEQRLEVKKLALNYLPV